MNYDFLLKKDEWSEDDITSIFDVDDQNMNEFCSLFYSSITAKTLKTSRVEGGNWESTRRYYFFRPTDVINWAYLKGMVIPDKLKKWRNEQLNTQVDEITQSGQDEEITESERKKLLKQIGAMALVLAKTSKIYKWGDSPNASRIAKDVDSILSQDFFKDIIGTKSTEMGESISKGIGLLLGED